VIDSTLKDSLLSLHPWYLEQITAPNQWQLARAVTGRFSDPAVKREFLNRGDFENETQYRVRVLISPFLGKTEGIASSFAGAVFAKQPEIKYGPAEQKELDAFGQMLEQWADNVDGQGSSLTELLETNSDEAVPMGLVAFYVTKPKLTPEQAAALDAVPTGTRNAAGQLPTDIVKGLGIDQAPRVVKFAPENVTNWECDEQGRPVWVILTHHISRQDAPTEMRKSLIQWIVLTRTEAIVYEAPYTSHQQQSTTSNIARSSGVSDAGTGAPGSPPLNEAATPAVFPVAATLVGDPIETARVTHGLNRVPLALYYGGGRKIAPLQSRSILDGAKRADLAGFQERSWATISAYLHAVPMLQVILKNRTLSNLYRDATNSFILNEGESVDYKNTDAGAFDTAMKRVEELDFQASRLSGADAVGTFNGGPQAESGTAKQSRFNNTESRSLARIAKDAADCHYDLLDIAARYLMGVAPPIDAQAFQGSVKYTSRFDLADRAELVDEYLKIGPKIKSLTWHKGQLKRIAQLSRGEISKDEWSEIEAEIDALTEEDITPPPPTMTAPGGQGGAFGKPATMTAGQPKPPVENRTERPSQVSPPKR